MAGTTSTNTDELSAQARGAVEQTKQRLSERVGQQKGSFTREIGDFAQVLRSVANQYEGREGGGSIAGYARRGADNVERLGQVLDRKTASEMLGDLERMCRERPLVVGAAALLAGFLGARIARSASASRRAEIGQPSVSISEDVVHEVDPRDVMREEGGI